MAITGSIRDLKINTLAYDVVSEADLTVKPTTELTSTPTSGASIISAEKKNADVEGVQVNASDTAVLDALELLGNSGAIVPVSFTLAGGQVFSSPSCSIGVGDFSTKTGIVELTLMPTSGWSKS